MKFVAEYIWIGGAKEIRSKSRTVTIDCNGVQDPDVILKEILNIELYENWTYDGSSTGQADRNSSEIILKPVAVYSDPFRKAPNVLVLCETYNTDNTPTETNSRISALNVFNTNKELKPWFGLEQAFYIMENCKCHPTRISNKPFGCGGEVPDEQGQYYCSVGGNNALGRKIAEQAYHLILEAGITASGMNAEVSPAQWEIQIGPCEGISAGDQCIIMRYILQRVSELHNVQISLEPEPLKGHNISGCHINFSTKPMRDENGIDEINKVIENLSENHESHSRIYGNKNEQSKVFTFGVGSRNTSIRIPTIVDQNKKGYIEDRRPPSNIDPYLVTSLLFSTST